MSMKLRAASAVALIPLILGVVLSVAAPANAASYGRLVDTATGFCLDGNGSSAYVHTCNGGNYQQWALVSKGNGFYQLQQSATLKCLDWSGSRGVYMNACNGGSYQEWSMTSNGYGMQLKNHAAGTCLDSNATPRLYVQACNAGNYQRWHR